MARGRHCEEHRKGFGNELCHGDWRDYDYEYDSLLYSYKSALNPRGQTKSAGNTMENSAVIDSSSGHFIP